MSPTHAVFSFITFFLIFLTALVPQRVVYTATPIQRGHARDTNIALIVPPLETVMLMPGTTWSFNETVGHPDMYPLITAGGVYGGGWCDLASRYAELARVIGLEREFPLHSTPLLEVERQDNVSIWNMDGSATQEQDLRITNTSSFFIMMNLEMNPDTFIVQASWWQPYFLRSGLLPLP